MHDDGLGNNAAKKKEMVMKGGFHRLHKGGSLLNKSEGERAQREAEMDKVEEEWMEEKGEKV